MVFHEAASYPTGHHKWPAVECWPSAFLARILLILAAMVVASSDEVTTTSAAALIWVWALLRMERVWTRPVGSSVKCTLGANSPESLGPCFIGRGLGQVLPAATAGSCPHSAHHDSGVLGVPTGFGSAWVGHRRGRIGLAGWLFEPGHPLLAGVGSLSATSRPDRGHSPIS